MNSFSLTYDMMRLGRSCCRFAVQGFLVKACQQGEDKGVKQVISKSSNVYSVTRVRF